MKASDLRLGNLIEMREGKWGWKPHFVSINTIRYFDEHFIRGIILTEELLLAFGFIDYRTLPHKTTKKAYFDINIGTHQFAWNIKPSHSKLRILHYFGIWRVIAPANDSVRLQYVHQLQNLYFALTGKELEMR